MAAPLFKGKIDVSKILKEYIFQGKKGKYIDVVIWENQNGEDSFGFTHAIQQELPREARDSGMKSPYIGNLKGTEQRQQAPRTQATRPTPPPAEPLDDDDIPF